MEVSSRRLRWTDNRRSQNKKPPHGSWKCTVPSWEKKFCKTVGSLDWNTLLRMKKYMQFYDNVIKWDDSAGEEAFHDAKKRYWADINGFSCDIPLPDPDLYIQNIDWDSEINPGLTTDLDNMLVSPKSDHDEPVLIFGDSFVENQGFSVTGWGDAEDNLEGPNNYSDNYVEPWGHNWTLGYSRNDVAASGWTDCNDDNDGWEYNNENGQGWGYNGNNENHVGQNIEDEYVSSYGASGVRKSKGDKGPHKGTIRGKQDKRAGYTCGPVGQRTWIRVGEGWNWEKRIS